MSADPVRVLLATERGALRESLVAAIEATGAAVCALPATRATALADCRRCRPDLCIVDALLPGDGASAVRGMAVEFGVPVLLLADHPTAADLLAAARAGAVGVVDSRTDAGCWGRLIAAAVAGEAVVPRHLVGRLLAEVRLLESVHGGAVAVAGQGLRLATLTRREREVLDRLCEGDSTARIARILSVEPVTVRSHVAAVMRKLQVHDRRSAVELVRDTPGPRDRPLRPTG